MLNDASRVFGYFKEICAIPHGSGNTRGISEYCVNFAKNHGLEYMRDEYNNVIIKKPAFSGYENAESIILQGHLDMVCEKDDDYNIDFENEAIKIYTDGDFIRAHQTTLGADDGIAIAMILALLERNDLPHPAIEAVFTSDEETGMDGAKGLDASLLQAHTLLNIDTEDEGIFTVSCAGGARARITVPVKARSAHGFKYTLTVGGLTGGHSGMEIHHNRANANKVLCALINALSQYAKIGIFDFSGGQKTNAIPAFAKAEIIADAEITDEILGEFNNIKFQYAATDPDMGLSMQFSDEGSALAAEAETITTLMSRLPDGVIKMSDTIDGLVETSSNIGIAKIENHCFTAELLVRSSVNSAQAELLERIEKIASEFTGSVKIYDEYPAWEYRESSPLRESLTKTYRAMYNKSPKIEAIHAGLECGIFAGKIENLDCVSIGPDIFDAHTPRERLSVSSAKRLWEFLLEALRAMKD